MAKTKTTAVKIVKSIVPPPRSVDLNTAEMHNPEGVKPTYSNNAAVLMTPHEFRVLFSELVVSSPTDVPQLQLRANIAMSPTQFKAVVSAVTQTLENFEKQFGEISWPPKNQ